VPGWSGPYILTFDLDESRGAIRERTVVTVLEGFGVKVRAFLISLIAAVCLSTVSWAGIVPPSLATPPGQLTPPPGLVGNDPFTQGVPNRQDREHDQQSGDDDPFTHCAPNQEIRLGQSGWTAIIPRNVKSRVDILIDSEGTLDGHTYVAIEIVKRFIGAPDPFNTVPPIFIEFAKSEHPAADWIIINDELVQNDTPAAIVRFEMAVEDSVGFDPTQSPSGDVFSMVVYGQNRGYQNLPTVLAFYDGVLPKHPQNDLFQPGQETGWIQIVTDPSMVVGQRFFLKERAYVPEPTSLVFLAFSLIGLRTRNK